MLTKRPKEVLEFVKQYSAKHEYAPSLEEIRKRFRFASVSTAHFHVRRLQEFGYLQKEQNQPRAVSVTGNKRLIEVKVVGTIAAGQPIEAIEVPGDTITITKDEIGKYGQHYALRVVGSSMIDEGIFDGDVVVIRKQESAENGQTVVAVIDNNQATLKKLYRESSRFRLQPANPSLFPIYRRDVEIRGVVVKIVRNLESHTEREGAHDGRFSRRVDYSWDYRGENTKTFTHGIHTYPAMFIPQVARRLLETYSNAGDTICDIFCGSGTALVESKLLGRNAYGIDLNPLAIFLARAKTTPINPRNLMSEYVALLERMRRWRSNVKKPSFKNLEFWFKEEVVVQLAQLKAGIRAIDDEVTRNFMMVAFSETVRHSSNTKTGEFKLVRMKGDRLAGHNPDVLSIFRKKAEANIAGMSNFYKDSNKQSWTRIIYGDSSKGNRIEPSSVDCIVTSPPYGDSRTTVAYGQFSRLSAQWIDIFDDPDTASAVDNNLLGGRASKTLMHSLCSRYLSDVLDKIAKVDEARARDVLSFYIGLNDCLKQAQRMLKSKKYFCLVVGNRLVKQVRIPTDFIIAELGERLGFTCEDIVVRNIPGKRMPMKNSPTNVVGVIEETMNRESVVVLRKY